MSDVTQILAQIEQGDPTAAEELLPLVYDELRRLAASKMAAERSDHTLQATALVHEAYVRLVGCREKRSWDSRGHFFAAAAEAMRRILINHARDQNRHKRGGGKKRIDLASVKVAVDSAPEELLAIDEALEKLSDEDPRCAELVKLRFFCGLTLDEAATTLNIGRRTADRYWAFARAWLFDFLNELQD